jgi:phosphatidylinositol alpha-1,6-mannosyltransferase
MRILVLTPTFLPLVGGAEIVILEVYRRLADRHEVLLVTADKGAAPSGQDHLVDFPVVRYKDRITTMRFRGHRTTGGIVPPFSLSAVRAVQRAVEEFRPDVISAHYMSHTGLAAVVARKRYRVPSVLSFMGRDVPGPRTPYGWKYYCRWVARNVTDVIYVSDYCRKAVFGESKSAPGCVIPCGVDLHRFIPNLDAADIRERLGLNAETSVLFSMQRLAPVKRVDILIRAMPRILRNHPRAVLVVGGTGPSRPGLESLVRETGLAQSVRFTGYIADLELPRYYAMADVFVFHTTYETFGVVLAEAMAAGKPIVSVRSTAIPDVISDGTTGILARPLDPDDLAEKVCLLLDSPSERERLGRNARVWAEENLGWDPIANQYESVLETAARGS